MSVIDYLLRAPFRSRVPWWKLFVDDDWSAGPTPPERAVVRAPGPRPIQMLLLGGGLATGYGVASHEVSLAGHFARQVAKLTHRGVDLEVSAGRHLTATQALERAQDADPNRYDAVVLSVGIEDALDATAPRRWAIDMDRLISHFTQGLPGQPDVFVLSVPTLSKGIAISPIARGAIDRLALRLDEQLRLIGERRREVRILSLDPADGLGDFPQRSSDTYRRWAAQISHEVGRVVVDRVDEHTYSVSETVRTAAVHALNILDTPADERFDHIVTAARERFQSTAAALSLMDSDRQWFKSASGVDMTEVARGTTFCEWTIRGATAFSVTDAVHDHRFKDMPIVTDAGVRAYAGHPILDAHGTPVGSICVLYDRPHEFSPEQLLFLRELAGLVESLLATA